MSQKINKIFLAKISIIFLFCILVSFNILISQDNTKDISKDIIAQLALGEKFYKEKNYKQSRMHYKLAMDINPGSIKAHMGYARVSLLLGAKKEALNSFKKILDNDPKNKEALAGVVEVLAEEEKFDEAMKLLEDGLKDEPYHPLLLLTRASVLLKMGKNELALKKLEEAKKYVSLGYEYNLLFARSHIALKKFKIANEILDKVIAEYPENPGGFIEKAKLNYAIAEHEPKVDIPALMNDSIYLLKTALALNKDNYDKENSESKRLLIKNLIWFHKYEEAIKYCDELLDVFPTDPTLHYYNSYLGIKTNNDSKPNISFGKMLDIQDLNEISRFSAESYALSKLNEFNPTRTSLGKYRLDMYLGNKNDYLYSYSYYNLERASKLIPNNSKLKKELSEYYYYSGDLIKLIHMLEKERKEDPTNFKIHNRLEAAISKFKDKLLYKEGFVAINGNVENEFRSEQEIFIFDLKPEQLMNIYPDTGIKISESLKFALGFYPRIKVITGIEDDEIRKNIRSSQKEPVPYTDAINYSSDILDSLDINRKLHNQIRYIGYGSFLEEKNLIKVKFNIYDRNNGKLIENLKVTSNGRNSLAEVSVRLADKILSEIPLMGKIIKLKEDRVLLNIGSKDLVTKGKNLGVVRENKIIAEIEPEIIEEFTTIGIPMSKDWKKVLELKDNVILMPDKTIK